MKSVRHYISLKKSGKVFHVFFESIVKRRKSFIIILQKKFFYNYTIVFLKDKWYQYNDKLFHLQFMICLSAIKLKIQPFAADSDRITRNEGIAPHQKSILQMDGVRKWTQLSVLQIQND